MSKGRRPNKQDGAVRLQFLSPEEAWMRKEPDWLVTGVLPTNSLALLYGKADTYKTFAAIDLAACIGTRQPWHGHQVVKPGITAYVVAEEEDAFPKRIEAWAIEHQVSRAATQVYQLHQPIKLLEDAWIDGLILAIKGIARKTRTPVQLCVIDTLSMCLDKGREMGDLGAVSVGLNRVRVETGATILLVHHETLRTGRARGDTTLEGNWAVRIRLEPGGTWKCKVTCEKQSNADKFKEPGSLSLREHPVTLRSGRVEPSLSVIPDPGDVAPFVATVADEPEVEGHGVPDDVAAVTLARLGRTGPAEFGRELHISRTGGYKKLREMVERGWAVPLEGGQYEASEHLRRSCLMAA